MSAEMPEPYRLWRMCEEHSSLWWPGGVSNQPHILMAEFAACEAAYSDFREQHRNIARALDANK